MEVLNGESLKSEKEAAAYLRASVVTLWRWRKNGEISFRRIGGRVFYHSTDLSEFLERCKRPAK